MCGIFALLNNNYNNKYNSNYDNYNNTDIISHNDVNNEFMKGQKRGPEFSKLDTSYTNLILGFHRLAINGLNNESNQPLVINDIVLICNGEIYNYKQLYKIMNIIPTTDSDCEVIIHLYEKYGIEQTLNMLDGVYSFILYDNRIDENLNKKMYVARDPIGVRPLYYLKNKNDNYRFFPLVGFASELKCLEKIYNTNNFHYEIRQFAPGTYSAFNMSNEKNSLWKLEKENVAYFIPGFSHSWLIDTNIDNIFISNMYLKIAAYLNTAVYKRCSSTERPIACLLSGGLDSSLIAALVNNYYTAHSMPNKLETYSIGLEGSEDLKYARIVADYLETNHTEIIVTEQEMFDIIPEVIKAIESYDTTTVRASIGNYLLGKYISAHSEAKVIFNGDGSDELFGGYLYMNKCPDDIEFDKETRRLIKDIHLFDVLRSDKSISSNGLEPRTPFLDKSFVNYILSIPPYYRNHKNHDLFVEKYILRHSFSIVNFRDYNNRQLIPDEILWRKKEAFSDGVSGHGRSLYQILQEKIAEKINKEAKDSQLESIQNGQNKYYFIHKANLDNEKMYYKDIFTKYFPNCFNIIPYYWMPKYTDATDPSARTLDIYEKTK
jgi:asparagine synthase (glutamine-hydrolysing)